MDQTKVKDTLNREQRIFAVMQRDHYNPWTARDVAAALGDEAPSTRKISEALIRGAHVSRSNPPFKRIGWGRYQSCPAYFRDLQAAGITIDDETDDEVIGLPDEDKEEWVEAKDEHIEGVEPVHFNNASPVRRIGRLSMDAGPMSDDPSDSPSDDDVRVFLDDHMFAVLVPEGLWLECPVKGIQKVALIEKKRLGVIITGIKGFRITKSGGDSLAFYTNAGDAEQWVSAIESVIKGR